MCEFISFKIRKTETGLAVFTAPSLDSHDSIPGDGYEGEWRIDDDGKETLEVRVNPDVSDNVKSELEAWVKKTYKTRQKMIDKSIAQYLKDGILPDYFYNHSKLDDRKLRLFACDCAERTLPIFEKSYPNDNRPRHAIEVARLFADGRATNEERAAAWDAAWAAAWAAAWDAAWAAAWAAARAAAQDAAWAAAWDAAWDAARAAAWDAAWAAAWDAEKSEQAKILLGYVNQKGN